MTESFILIILLLVIGYCLISKSSVSEPFQLGSYENYHWVSPYELDKIPSIWNGRRVSIEGAYYHDQDISVLNDDIWVTLNLNASIADQSKREQSLPSYDIVRISGTFYRVEDERYGYQGRYRSHIVADQIIYCQHLGSKPMAMRNWKYPV